MTAFLPAWGQNFTAQPHCLCESSAVCNRGTLGVKWWKFVALLDTRLAEEMTPSDLTSSLPAAPAQWKTDLPMRHQASVFHLTLLAWDVKKPLLRAGWREANNSLGSWSLGWEPHSIVFLLSFTQKKRKASEKFENPLVFMFSGMERRNELSSPFRVDFRLALLRQFRSPKIHTWITIYTTIIYMRL